MGRCHLCKRQMLGSEGCIAHDLLLADATVIDSPRHDADGSLGDPEGRDCHDCAASPGGYHHPGCDVARQPDGSQVLMELVASRRPDATDWGDDVVFVIYQDEPTASPVTRGATPIVTAVRDHESATAYVESMNAAYDAGYRLAATITSGTLAPPDGAIDDSD